MPRFVAVFDTNVLFSAIGWSGNPRQCLDYARQGAIQAVTCEQIMEELLQKLRRKLDFSDQQVLETTVYLMGFMRTVAITGNLKGGCPDPKDDMVLECAVAAQATHVLTGDKKHLLPLRSFQGIAVVSPSDFVLAVDAILP
jgi:putative PIN family toxin of toxin-antitoxin system